MCETEIDLSMSARLLESDDGYVIIWIDGPYQSRSYQIPTEDATTFSEYNELDCRAIVFTTDRSGGKLWALYPSLDGEIQVRYGLRQPLGRSSCRSITEVVEVDEPMTNAEIDDRWTVLWERGEDDADD